MVDGIVTIPLPGSTLGGRPCAEASVDGHADVHSFIAGPENRLVEIAVASFMPNAPIVYNPLFLHGRSGTGKSHLALGFAALAEEQYGQERVVYTTAIDFARQMAEAVQTQTIDRWRAHFRRAATIVVDDIHRLAIRRAKRERQKQHAQEELLHILDFLLAQRHRVVVTASEPAADLSGLLPALQSRLLSGLTIPLSPPGPKTRLALIREWLDQRNLALSDTAMALLAEGLEGTAGELKGALAQIQMAAQAEGRPLDAITIREYLIRRDTRHQSELAEITMAEIATATAKFFRLSVSALRSSSRQRGVVTARGVAVYMARRLTNKSFQQIGRYFGGRDHSTVMHAYRKIEKALPSDSALRQAVEYLCSK